jgi:predicted O-linked N-acetylglucosamine transferase (SPINDLY family)
LAALRRKLERGRLGVPLFDIARFTKNLEAAYSRMWKQYCSTT